MARLHPRLNFSARILRALGSETALAIFYVLGLRQNAHVSEIARLVGISMPTASHHLKRFEAIGVVYARRSGRTIHYALSEDETTTELLRGLRKMLGKRS